MNIKIVQMDKKIIQMNKKLNRLIIMQSTVIFEERSERSRCNPRESKA